MIRHPLFAFALLLLAFFAGQVERVATFAPADGVAALTSNESAVALSSTVIGDDAAFLSALDDQDDGFPLPSSSQLATRHFGTSTARAIASAFVSLAPGYRATAPPREI